ncbi:MAG TPA: cysteine--tRNA ligase [Candidatus Binatia bacterium]|nr:cysteine--tRNA ligase [Candidatus Binatia bacterium]
MIRLFDTGTRSLQPLREPAQGRPIGIYVCGITPYDGGHLGHAFTYHTFDVLVRRLRSLGQPARSVRNVTDVDDDMLRTAGQRGLSWQELGEQVVRQFDRDMAAIDILEVDATPWASQHVPAMIDWISRLVGCGSAYAAQGWVFFEVASLPSYGSLSRLSAGSMIELSRQRGANPDDPRKRAPLDFVLWQPSLPGEPAWDSPWSRGRPGWHIECSVLATRELGSPVDVHGGGEDLIYPHHESEIAQAEGIGISPYVGLWSHVAMVGYQGAKMSKSLGNLVFVSHLLERTSPAAVRLLLAGHHHREGWEYREAELAAAGERARRYAAAARSEATLDVSEAERWRRDFLARIDDDLDTPGALARTDALAERLLAAPSSPADPEQVSGRRLLAELLTLVGAASAVEQPVA